MLLFKVGSPTLWHSVFCSLRMLFIFIIRIMAQYLNDDLEYMVDDYYDMADFEDDTFGESQRQRNSEDSDVEDDFDMNKPKTDTSALEARNGKDIQGIPWERLNYTRDKYRETRLKEYKNYENLSRPREELQKECKHVEKGRTFYDFQFNTRLVKSTIVHFQVEIFFPLLFPSFAAIELSMMCPSTGFSFPFTAEESIMGNIEARCLPDAELLRNALVFAAQKGQRSTECSWTYCTHTGKEKHPGSLAQSLSRVQISTLAVKDNLMVAGGFQGELICKHLNHPGVSFSMKITAEENAITNAVDIYCSSSGSTRLICANNDAQVRVFDAENFACLSRFSFSWSVNNTSVSPDGKLLAVLGDSADCLIADAQSGKEIGNLKGHLDYSFTSAWHPDGRILATGNQDTTCRLWDVRNLSKSLDVLKGRMGAIRAIKFTTDGRFMAMAEPADFVHIYDAKSGYIKEQEIDLFGEIAGISFSPDTEALFVGVADRTYGSLLEFNRRRCNQYLDSII
ncbi:hypothetical protein HHK36_030662 [Tetracentron sinense]|uniref:Transducin/WD40 repeat-like superfamily protein n=1 Tax=Tetracentron sinense TaxID=13715 RepID=A0A835CYH6_TETSI|nr:hypothetical protein HHK36_030662 [Tetracentron sinense]